MAEPLLEGNEISLPFSLEAEQSVLGAVLLKPECLSTVLEYISAESFYRKQHQQIFNIMLQMYTTAQGIDVITVLEEVKKQETVRRDAPKIGRNDDCPCGSGKKYKNCCMKKDMMQ